MRFAKILPAVLFTLIFSAQSVLLAGPKDHIKVGDTVAAQWTNGKYYVGKVTESGPQKFHILFEDGDRRAVEPAHVFELRDDREFKVGERVLAAWKGAQMYPGVITAVRPHACQVKWDDGDAPMDVQKGRMIREGNK